MLTSKDSDLSSYFEKSFVNPLSKNGNNIINQIFIINHDASNKGKVKGELALEHIFGFCKTSKKLTKN